MHPTPNTFPIELLEPRGYPCVTLYQPTYRHFPENKQDPIRFKNLLKPIEAELRQGLSAKEVKSLLEPLQGLADDENFWNHTLDGLAAFLAPGFFRLYLLQRPVPELGIAAENFRIKPLIRIFQSADRYQVLGLSRKEIVLFEGNRDALDEIEPAQAVPRTITDALGEETSDPHLTVASYGGVGGAGMHHGHGSKKDEIDIDTERFFRAVDKAILEHHSKPSGLPLLMAALPEHISLFRRISRNPYLASGAVEAHPETLSLEALREQAWRAIEPAYLSRLAALSEEFTQAYSKELGASDPADAARAAAAGRVAVLLVDASKQLPGRLNQDTGVINNPGGPNPEADDLLDDISELVLKKGGEVVVVPTERMPAQSLLAAIFRF